VKNAVPPGQALSQQDLRIKLYNAINESDKPREVNHWHASSIAKCPRALYFERKGIPGLKENEAGGGKKLRWRAGHAIEATIRPELEKIYPKLLTNVRFTNEELDLTGEFDGYDPESRTLISVKSVHDFAMKTINGDTGLKENTGKTNARGNIVWALKKEPYIHHQWQEHAYVLLMQPGTWEVGQITYVYITLGGLIDTYTTPVIDEILKRVSDKVTYLNEAWSAQIPPVCLCYEGLEMYQVTDQYCAYRTASGCCDEKLLVKEEK
jgi:hypothetical protein